MGNISPYISNWPMVIIGDIMIIMKYLWFFIYDLIYNICEIQESDLDYNIVCFLRRLAI